MDFEPAAPPQALALDRPARGPFRIHGRLPRFALDGDRPLAATGRAPPFEILPAAPRPPRSRVRAALAALALAVRRRIA